MKDCIGNNDCDPGFECFKVDDNSWKCINPNKYREREKMTTGRRSGIILAVIFALIIIFAIFALFIRSYRRGFFYATNICCESLPPQYSEINNNLYTRTIVI